jgi:hypothetical protein
LGYISLNGSAGYPNVIGDFRVAKAFAKKKKYVPLTLGQPL